MSSAALRVAAAVLLVGPLPWFVGLLPSCTTAPSPVSFTGTSKPPVAEPGQLLLLGGKIPPDGYQLIGVVTARCGALNGAGGILDGPCNESTMTDAARRKAATVGGTALLDLRCEERVIDRVLSYAEAGVQTQVRSNITCQGSVLRATSELADAASPLSSTERPARSGDVKRFEISGVGVQVTVTKLPGAPTRAPTPVDEIGELDGPPKDHLMLAKLDARCETSCSPSTARRGVKRAAAALGAVAIAALRCVPEGETWRCQAVAIDAQKRPAPTSSRQP